MPADACDRYEAATTVRDALESLSEDQRSVLVLTTLHGFTAPEVADLRVQNGELFRVKAQRNGFALAEALYLSHQQIVTVIPTIADAGDREFGGRVLRETFQPFSVLARELEAHRQRVDSV